MSTASKVLNRNPDNFFNDNEQLAFCVGLIVPGELKIMGSGAGGGGGRGAAEHMAKAGSIDERGERPKGGRAAGERRKAGSMGMNHL